MYCRVYLRQKFYNLNCSDDDIYRNVNTNVSFTIVFFFYLNNNNNNKIFICSSKSVMRKKDECCKLYI